MGLIIKGLHIEEIIIDTDDEEKQIEPIQEESKAAPKKTVHKPLDKGKVGALYKAGWSVAKIADEMKCGQSTIYKAIKEMSL